jgi:hypothetical protein
MEVRVLQLIAAIGLALAYARGGRSCKIKAKVPVCSIVEML